MDPVVHRDLSSVRIARSSFPLFSRFLFECDEHCLSRVMMATVSSISTKRRGFVLGMRYLPFMILHTLIRSLFSFFDLPFWSTLTSHLALLISASV